MRFLFRLVIGCLIGAGIGSIFGHLTHRTPKPATAAEVKPVEQKPVTKLAFPDLDQDTQKPADKKKEIPEPVRVSGYVVLGRRVNVVLSDGRTLTELDPELKKIHRNAVFVGDEKLFMKQPKDKVVEPAAPATAAATAVNTPPVDSRPPPPPPPASSWVVHSDGVSRLVTGPTLGK